MSDRIAGRAGGSHPTAGGTHPSSIPPPGPPPPRPRNRNRACQPRRLRSLVDYTTSAGGRRAGRLLGAGDAGRAGCREPARVRSQVRRVAVRPGRAVHPERPTWGPRPGPRRPRGDRRSLGARRRRRRRRFVPTSLAHDGTVGISPPPLERRRRGPLVVVAAVVVAAGLVTGGLVLGLSSSSKTSGSPSSVLDAAVASSEAAGRRTSP